MQKVLKKHWPVVLATAILLVFILFAWQQTAEDGTSGVAGHQIIPPRPLSDMVLVDADNNALPAAFLKGQWSYVIFADAECDELCEQQINLTQAVVKAQAEQAPKRLLVMGYFPEDEFLQRMKSQHEDMVVAILTRPIWAIFAVQFAAAIEAIGGTPFFLVNPNAMVVMGYDELVSQADVNLDFNKLRVKP